MNQTKNLIQWKNLTDDEKAGFDFEGFAYEGQDSGSGSENTKFTKILPCGKTKGMAHRVYRLVIEEDKWYYCKYLGNPHMIKGVEVTYQAEEHSMSVLRPAKPSEIPKPKRVFKDGAFYPVILKVAIGLDIAEFKDGEFDTLRHLNPRQINGNFKEDRFSWIGEELKIEWGEE